MGGYAIRAKIAEVAVSASMRGSAVGAKIAEAAVSASMRGYAVSAKMGHNGEKVAKMANGYAHGACAQCSPNTMFLRIY